MAYVKAIASSVSNVDTGPGGPGISALDGVLLNNGDPILLTAQTTKSENGLWIFDTDATPLARPAANEQFHDGTSLDNATIVWVTGGALRAGTVWGVEPAMDVTVDTTPFELAPASLPAVRAQRATTENINIASTVLIVDPKFVRDAMMEDTVAPTTLVCSVTRPFVPADVGKPISVVGAGLLGADLDTTIAAYTSVSEVTLTDPCQTTVTAEVADGEIDIALSDTSKFFLNCAASTPFVNTDAGKIIIVAVLGRAAVSLLQKFGSS